MSHSKVFSDKSYDVIVIGAGHAGAEAALAAARMNAETLLLTMHLDAIAQMSCNPAIGGTAKGQIVREIDALGGEMAKITDRAGIQFRMLNRSKGPAVWAPRAQCDKKMYSILMKQVLEGQARLDLRQAEARAILVEDGAVRGIETTSGMVYRAGAVIVTPGTFLNGLIHIGDVSYAGGRNGEMASCDLSESLRALGFEVRRLKTGTPARLNAKSLNFSRLEVQPGDDPPHAFSFSTERIEQTQLPCYITYTNERTHRIIRENISRSPLFSGKIQGRGPRYCPSIEDKVYRFPDKDRHQLYLEPEGRFTNEYYVNGLSTSFPQDLQIQFIKSIEGLENAEVMRFGYAIEYDFCPPTQIKNTLETKNVENLYFAGQINGTSGYEEAACQGLMAGINAVLKLGDRPPFVLSRSEAYIGVLIDDLVTNGTDEPYRMFTSRAEHRLLLRQDNADKRLMEYGFKYGLINNSQYEKFRAKYDSVNSWINRLKNFKHNNAGIDRYLRRPEVSLDEVLSIMDDKLDDIKIREQVEIEIKYAGYIERELDLVGRFRHYEEKKIPEGFDYKAVKSMRAEAVEKFMKVRPSSLGQASRISGITPCDITVLSIQIEKLKRSSQ